MRLFRKHRFYKIIALLATVLFFECTPNFSDGQEHNQDDLNARLNNPRNVINGQMEEIETEPGKLRVFVVQLKQEIGDCAMPQDFLSRIESIVESVQPYFSIKHPNLFVFPEYTGFMCCFSGTRGSGARQAHDVLSAFVALAASYLPQISYYIGAYPDISPQRALFLALTDAVWRPFNETFSYIAKKHRIYVLAAAVVADAKISYEQDDVTFFVDPSILPQDYVYLPQDQNVYNQAILFGPDGSILHKVRKVHLSGELENEIMDIEPGSAADIKLFSLNGVNVGITVCLDTWYADIIDALVADGMNFLVQLSADPAMWGHYTPPANYWESEAWYSGIWEAVQEHGEILFGANSMLTGNLFEIPFDGQSSIIANSGETEDKGYIGTAYHDGFIALAPWVIDDPCDGKPNEICRTIISDRSESLLLGGEHANEYVETVLWTDLDFEGLK